MAPDYRADRSDTPEGKGRARGAWDTYARAIGNLSPVRDLGARYATHHTADLLGFWLAWHLHGGFEGLVEMGMHPSTVWRKVKRFRTVFGAHPDVFELPGVDVDPAAYWQHFGKA